MRSLALSLVLALSVAVPAQLLAQAAPPEKKPPAEVPDDIEALKETVARQAELIEKLRKELAETREALDKLKGSSTEKPADNPQPKEERGKDEDALEGKITGVSQDNKIVVIDLGKSHDLAEGDLFEVLRDGKRIGKIRICRTVDQNISNADVIESDAELLPGDRVARIGKAKRAADSSSQSTQEPQSELEKLDRRVATLEGLYNDLAKQVERIQKSLEGSEKPVAAGGSSEGTEKKTSQPEETAAAKRPFGLQTKVADIEANGVILWVGTKHGVKEGDTFLIERGDREIAWLKVVSLIEDMCRAAVISKKGDIRKDDIAVLKPLSPK